MKNVTFYLFEQIEQKKLIEPYQLTKANIPTVLEVAFGCQSVRPMSVDILPDEANTRSQQRGGFKGEGYNANNELNRYEALACELAAKYWRLGKRVLIACESLQQAERLDEALWQRSPEQFVPHNLAGEGPKQGAPIELAWPERRGSSPRHLLINLLPQLADFVTVFQEVIDFVPYEEHLKQLARERYKSYRRVGFHLSTATLPT
ncbi:DNA polymerase III chi subunit [Candidatus Regiella insecticola LSR1]|uniref:DNA polymerase III chi subunit n=2 Tax=Candidatus Regiella insecticola TaxID=138073 RepID=E0WSA5_9ENTR|nr:DNA polymerase III chi subunit [Candidatus Regiella insecticola LSR1]